jgi:hypothetical protein
LRQIFPDLFDRPATFGMPVIFKNRLPLDHGPCKDRIKWDSTRHPYLLHFTKACPWPFLSATCGYSHHAQENPPEGVQEEELMDPLDEKVESSVSASP